MIKCTATYIIKETKLPWKNNHRKITKTWSGHNVLETFLKVWIQSICVVFLFNCNISSVFRWILEGEIPGKQIQSAINTETDLSQIMTHGPISSLWVCSRMDLDLLNYLCWTTSAVCTTTTSTKSRILHQGIGTISRQIRIFNKCFWSSELWRWLWIDYTQQQLAQLRSILTILSMLKARSLF